MPRAGLSTAVVVERAGQMLDENPSESLNLAALADSFGVRTPSLYKHIDGMSGLQRGIMLEARRSLTAAVAEATIGRSRDDAIRTMALAYRRWALEHPGRYSLTVHAALPGDEEDREVTETFLRVIFAVLEGYELHDDDAIDATRFLRSAIHGFIDLEAGSAFRMPFDLERSYSRLVDSVVTALETWTRG